MTREALGLFLHTRKIAQRHTLAQPQRQRDGRLGDGNILKDNVLDLIARLVKARDLDRGGIVPAAVMVQHLGGQGQPLKEAVLELRRGTGGHTVVIVRYAVQHDAPDCEFA